MLIQKSTAFNVAIVCDIAKLDTVSVASYLAPSGLYLSVAGGAIFAAAGSVSSLGGIGSSYGPFVAAVNLTAGDTANLGTLCVMITGPGGEVIGKLDCLVVNYDPTSGGGDPLNNPVPGSYAPGTAGYEIGTNLDAPVSSRGTSNYAGGAVASVTGNVGGDVVGNVHGLTNAAVDEVWERAYAALAGFTPLQVLRVLGAVLAGKTSGFPAGPGIFNEMNGTTPVVQASLDGLGNRTSVVVSP